LKGWLDFDLPPELEASGPPEARGAGRDAVRMMVAYRGSGALVGSDFGCLATFVEPDDVLVVNTSATLPAAVPAADPATGAAVLVHLSARLSSGPEEGEIWAAELRQPSGVASKPWPGWPSWEQQGSEGAPRTLDLVGRGASGRNASDRGATLEILAPYRASRRLWTCRVRAPGPVLGWLAENGRPIRYQYVDEPWPLSAYQTVFASEPGSAEMPSAGRPFTSEMVTRLVTKGVGFAPIVLHTGVSSPEFGEQPSPEPLRVPPSTASRVNAARTAGGRVIAVGTSAVRALESAFDPRTGRVAPLDGWTELVVAPDNGVKVVDGLLTGWHEPEASHLLMLEAIAGRPLLEAAYAAAINDRYLWHEFGDVALFLP
jgi:S-adenosylmethionine:tRNA ribosyltransferase-isomerase